MAISDPHNLAHPRSSGSGRYGIRITLPSADPLNNLLDLDWETYHWFETEEERSVALKDKAGKHIYSRVGDLPSLIYEKVTRDG